MTINSRNNKKRKIKKCSKIIKNTNDSINYKEGGVSHTYTLLMCHESSNLRTLIYKLVSVSTGLESIDILKCS